MLTYEYLFHVSEYDRIKQFKKFCVEKYDDSQLLYTVETSDSLGILVEIGDRTVD